MVGSPVIDNYYYVLRHTCSCEIGDYNRLPLIQSADRLIEIYHQEIIGVLRMSLINLYQILVEDTVQDEGPF